MAGWEIAAQHDSALILFAYCANDLQLGLAARWNVVLLPGYGNHILFNQKVHPIGALLLLLLAYVSNIHGFHHRIPSQPDHIRIRQERAKPISEISTHPSFNSLMPAAYLTIVVQHGDTVLPSPGNRDM